MAIGEATGLSAPSPLGLPVYSATGFDVLSILARVATRPNPKVVLGPVDLTCSFVVVDVRRHDHPIVYCSPSFCRLTGYTEAEVLGRNCRFLQSPDGQVQKGEQRRFTSPEAVAHLKKHLLADKECQTRIINYRKGGSAFINLVTVIPIAGGVSGLPHEESEVVYHVGFQVDLTEQPNVILQKLRDGSYMVNYSAPMGFSNVNGLLLGGSALGTTSGAKKVQIAQPLISKELKKMLEDPDFVRSIPISNSTTVPPAVTSTTSADKADPTDSNQWLNLMLLETCPDFVHVVSLKGSFLYVAPSVRRVLGYEPEEMVGGSIADFSHPEDIVPLMRELKESSSTGGSGSSLSQEGQPPAQISIAPRTVDLLFRARTKAGVYVWMECRGRLHVEPGKGRKAIILSGRAREMPRLKWDTVRRAGGGLARSEERREGGKRREREFWAMLSGQGSFIVVGSGVRDVLGWSAADLAGRPVGSVLSGDDTSGLEDEVRRMIWELRGGGGRGSEGGGEGEGEARRDEERDGVRVRSRLRRAEGGSVDGTVVLYRPIRDAVLDASPMVARSISPLPIICQIKLDDSLPIGVGVGGGVGGGGGGSGGGSGVFVTAAAATVTGVGGSGVSVSVSPSSIPLPASSSSIDSSSSLPSSSLSLSSSASSSSSLSSWPRPSSLSSSPPSSSLTSAPDSNVFEELETSRGSSWQYELQQLKFANQKLEEEVCLLESRLMQAAVGDGGGGGPGGGARVDCQEGRRHQHQHQEQCQQDVYNPFELEQVARCSVMYATPTMHATPATRTTHAGEWAARRHDHHTVGAKRSWESAQN